MSLKIDDIQKMAEKDLKLNVSELHIDAIKTPDIYNKYLKIFFAERKLLRALVVDYNRIKKEQYEYYMGKAAPEVYKAKPWGHKVRAGQVDKYLDADPDLQSAQAKMDLQKDKIEYLERLLKVIADRTWSISHAIAAIKLQNGIN
jgi:hypothetical protein